MGFTNSGLVSYTRISKNSNPRTGKICRMSVHCMAGNLSVETCGNVFANGAASSNYGIGGDGRVALYVEEKNRSWCTSNKDNDHKAVTIEVANCGGAPDWPVSAAAWNSLLNLATDICRRNGKTKLLWFNDRAKSLAYAPADDEMVITVHRWFANKECPGNYLYNRMGDLADYVTSRLSVPVEKPNTNAEEVPQPEILTDEKYLWDALDEINLTDFAKGGLFGNLFAESGLRSNNLQNSYEKEFNLSDEQYTTRVDNGSYTNFVRDRAGYGIAQWTYWSRKENMYKFIKARGKSIGDFRSQADFLVHELKTSFNGLITKLNQCTSLKQASDLVLTEFEKPAIQNDKVKNDRVNYSLHFYNLYAKKYKLPYTVRVKTDCLFIRTAPSNKVPKAGAIRDRGVYTIVEEKQGPGANLWGKLKSGTNWWISLDYTEKT